MTDFKVGDLIEYTYRNGYYGEIHVILAMGLNTYHYVTGEIEEKVCMNTFNLSRFKYFKNIVDLDSYKLLVSGN